jgi:hypothetical protein
MIEENLFKPMADANGFYDEDEDGNKTYFYPKISFNRLTIRDNAEVFDNLFQLYQKGSLPIDTIYEMFNLDPTEAHEKLKHDMFTVKDSTFNELLRPIYDAIGAKVMESTDIFERVVKTLDAPDGKPLNLKKSPEEGGEGGEDGEAGGMPSSEGQDGERGAEVQALADELVKQIEEKTPKDFGKEQVDSVLTNIFGIQPEQTDGEASEKDKLRDSIVETIKSKLPKGATKEQIDEIMKFVFGVKPTDTVDEKKVLGDSIIEKIKSRLPSKPTLQDVDGAIRGFFEWGKSSKFVNDMLANKVVELVKTKLPDDVNKEGVDLILRKIFFKKEFNKLVQDAAEQVRERLPKDAKKKDFDLALHEVVDSHLNKTADGICERIKAGLNGEAASKEHVDDIVNTIFEHKENENE